MDVLRYSKCAIVSTPAGCATVGCSLYLSDENPGQAYRPKLAMKSGGSLRSNQRQSWQSAVSTCFEEGLSTAAAKFQERLSSSQVP
jgi:hypothetical protein